jgi:Eco57I restriction-modification methylase
MQKTLPLFPNDESPESFLKEAYKRLGFEEGSLLDAKSGPSADDQDFTEWLEKGDWLSLANKIGAKKIFFVKNDPVIIFCEHHDSNDIAGIIKAFRQAWCMARPTCLFLALTGELRVYSLNNTPPKDLDDWQRIKPLAVAQRIGEVAEKLHAFRREQIESGKIFADKYFGDIGERADRRLIQDLKRVRQSLLNAGLSQRFAHALIGRSIFVRYLEDRGVLIPKYFDKVAADNSDWQRLLTEPIDKPALLVDLTKRRYHSVLQNKDFTYALFRQLADHFNGNMFPEDLDEQNAVEQKHLNLLRQFLLGDRDAEQLSLFFWAYDFEIIPTDLISSIYEEFYHENNEDDKGTHYTPSVLVEFVLSQVMSATVLATKPKILDPACGSGIFLVEAFRRIVRYNVQQCGRPLTSSELRDILRTQIAGVEINGEAIQVSAFSLYLALLHYQKPPDILAQIEKSNRKPLPHLIYDHSQMDDPDHYPTLHNADTFGLTPAERLVLRDKLSKKQFRGRTEASLLFNSTAALPLDLNSFDIILGNPPWGYKAAATQSIQHTQKQAQLWCDVFNWSIGDKELSQAFIARVLALLKPGGISGLLVSTGVLLKHHEKSRRFRRRWLTESTICTVVNFAHVRNIFFSSAIAPFAFVSFKRDTPDSAHRINYWSAKKTAIVDSFQAVVLRTPDLRLPKQSELLVNESLWKTYWWGNHRDAALISSLARNKPLSQLVEERAWVKGQGYTPGVAKSSGWLNQYLELPINRFTRYGPVPKVFLTKTPSRVHRRGIQDLYDGWRILIKRGITQSANANGRIEARLDKPSYCFRNSIHGIALSQTKIWERKVLTGILWSSLARYFFFLTASSWGTWHHEIHLEEILSLPIRFPTNEKLREKIVKIVDELNESGAKRSLGSRAKPVSAIALRKLERRLDDAIFELYELSESEQDLVIDMCEVGLELFYQRGDSSAVGPINWHAEWTHGTIEQLPTNRVSDIGLDGYLRAFLNIWNRQVEPHGEFQWNVIRDAQIPMLGVVFATQEKGNDQPPLMSNDIPDWKALLEQSEKYLLQEVTRNIYMDGMIRIVTDTEIFIVKRDERWLWTRSMAREDAEAAMLQVIHLQDAVPAQ